MQVEVFKGDVAELVADQEGEKVEGWGGRSRIEIGPGRCGQVDVGKVLSKLGGGIYWLLRRIGHYAWPDVLSGRSE